MFSKIWTKTSTSGSSPEQIREIDRLKAALNECDAVLIGAGAGLSTSAGFFYSGERFNKYFADFIDAYDLKDMYSGGFYPFKDLNEYWAYWSRYVYINRYMDTPKPVYEQLLELVKDKDYFVLTTNVDHCFQKAGFDKHRLYYMQGDYGLSQCSKPCCSETYDNKDVIEAMLRAQGFTIAYDGTLSPYIHGAISMSIPDSLIPVCPHCGSPLTMNLHADDTFVRDKGWHIAAQRYDDFLRRHKDMKILFLELGVGFNTPVIIKYPFWQMTSRNYKATYACINYGDVYAPKEIERQTICIDGDIGEVLSQLKY